MVIEGAVVLITRLREWYKDSARDQTSSFGSGGIFYAVEGNAWRCCRVFKLGVFDEDDEMGNKVLV